MRMSNAALVTQLSTQENRAALKSRFNQNSINKSSRSTSNQQTLSNIWQVFLGIEIIPMMIINLWIIDIILA